eukprot:4415645-Prymnesium_polylepis.2
MVPVGAVRGRVVAPVVQARRLIIKRKRTGDVAKGVRPEKRRRRHVHDDRIRIVVLDWAAVHEDGFEHVVCACSILEHRATPGVVVVEARLQRQLRNEGRRCRLKLKGAARSTAKSLVAGALACSAVAGAGVAAVCIRRAARGAGPHWHRHQQDERPEQCGGHHCASRHYRVHDQEASAGRERQWVAFFPDLRSSVPLK